MANPNQELSAVLYANEFRSDAIISEGPDAGRLCTIIRLAGCNLTCEACEQPSTWGPDVMSRPVRVSTFLDRLGLAGRVVITGGEPLLQQEGPALRQLVEGILSRGRTVHIETNGTIMPCRWLVDLDTDSYIRWRVAPKLFGPLATDDRRQRINNHARRWLVMNSSTEFLFPVEGPTEIDVIRRFCADHSLPPGRVWVYPLGAGADVLRIVRDIAPAASRAGFNVSTRLNVILGSR